MGGAMDAIMDFLRGESVRVLDALPVAVEICDRDGIIRYVNPAFLKATGLAAEERIGHSVHDVSPDGALAWSLKKKSAVAGLKNYPKGTSVALVSNSELLTVNGEIAGVIAVMQDISEIARLSTLLSATRQRLEDLQGQVRSIFVARSTFRDIVGASPGLIEAKDLALRAAVAGCPVLITGESGTGKELFAHAIHSSSMRASQPFVTINCSAIPGQLLESELFGYEKGSFTGATSGKAGLVEIADGGTVFLDEIGDMGMDLQAKVLRLIQFGEVQKIGSVKPLKVDIRIIAATNRDLTDLISKGMFRADLYYRLGAVIIHVPPLRDRRSDIPGLIAVLLPRIRAEMRKDTDAVDSAFISMLAESRYPWPGNVRELENVLRQAVIGGQIPSLGLGLGRGINHGDRAVELRRLADVERDMISAGLERYGCGVAAKRQIAEQLGLSLSALYNKIKVYRL